jgi:transposase
MTQKVRNWNKYNKALKKRGAIIFTFDEKYIEELYYSGKQQRGGAREYSAKMYEYLLTIKIMLRLPWRATMGFAEGMFGKIFPEQKLKVPDYAHAARESGKLNLRVKTFARIDLSAGMEIAFDSTGVNVYTTSGWHQRKYGKDALYRKREQWKKVHIALELNTMQIISVAYTDSNINDCEVIKELCAGVTTPVASVRADGAYDTAEVHKIITDWNAKAIIPPARTSKAQDELKKKPKIKKGYLEQRDSMIKEIRQYESFDEGLKAWKVSSGYHRRSLVESCMFRLKRTFGFYLQQKTEAGRLNEVITKVNALNLMASFGRAEYTS